MGELVNMNEMNSNAILQFQKAMLAEFKRQIKKYCVDKIKADRDYAITFYAYFKDSDAWIGGWRDLAVYIVDLRGANEDYRDIYAHFDVYDVFNEFLEIEKAMRKWEKIYRKKNKW